MSRRARAFGFGVWDFVVGDDWRLAVGVIAALGVTAIVAGIRGVSAWWIAPVCVALLLVVSLWRAGRPPGA